MKYAATVRGNDLEVTEFKTVNSSKLIFVIVDHNENLSLPKNTSQRFHYLSVERKPKKKVTCIFVYG